MAKFYKFPQGAVEHLSKRDKKLGRAMAEIGPIKAAVQSDPFKSLASSIVSQQISGRAAESIWNRLEAALGGVSPESVLAAADEKIRACGMSARKTEYLRGAAEAVECGALDFPKLKKAADALLIERLTHLRGVGTWTAEMLLIFTFGRHNILSFDDLGIRHGLMRLHSLEAISKKDFEKYRELYSPYGTVASLYLWRIAG